MAYCSQSDVQGEIQMPDLIAATDDGQTGSLNATILNQVISNASGEVDRYVGAVYDVPFVPTPVSVNSMAIIITCYRLLRRREVPDEKNKFYMAYKRVISDLEKIQQGTMSLDLSVTRDFSQIQYDSRASIFGGGNQLANSM